MRARTVPLKGPKWENLSKWAKPVCSAYAAPSESPAIARCSRSASVRYRPSIVGMRSCVTISPKVGETVMTTGREGSGGVRGGPAPVSPSGTSLTSLEIHALFWNVDAARLPAHAVKGLAPRVVSLCAIDHQRVIVKPRNLRRNRHAPDPILTARHLVPLSYYSCTATLRASGARNRNVTRRSEWTRGYSAPGTLDAAGLESAAGCAQHSAQAGTNPPNNTALLICSPRWWRTPNLLCHLVFQVLPVQIAHPPPQSLSGHRPGVGELQIGPPGGVELRPTRQAATVGIAGLGEVGPVRLHCGRHLLIDGVVLRGICRATQSSKYVRDLWVARQIP